MQNDKDDSDTSSVSADTSSDVELENYEVDSFYFGEIAKVQNSETNIQKLNQKLKSGEISM